MKYFVILSEGEYSDYSPVYFMGEVEITQKELDKKGEEVGDSLYDWFDGLPKRLVKPCEEAHSHYVLCNENVGKEELYYPETGEKAYSEDLSKKWFETMSVWLKEKGFYNVV